MYAVQVHVLNTAVAWLDMLLAEQRTFSKVRSAFLQKHACILTFLLGAGQAICMSLIQTK